MSSDTPTDELLRRLLGAISGDVSVQTLIHDARTEAEEEVRTLLKSAFKASMLRQAVEQLEGANAPPRIETTPAPAALAAGCYVYAITSASAEASGPAGPGIDPAFPVESLRCDDVQAIVSDVSLDEFGQAALNERTADPQWVEAKVRAHDRVVKNALSFGAVIPCRFCTIVRSREDVRQLLQESRERVASTLDSLRGKSEWGVKLFYAVPTEAKLDEGLTGRAYLQQKQRAVEDQRRQAREARDVAEALHVELAAAACDAALLPIRHREGDEVLLNGVYLVAEPDAEQFRQVLKIWSDSHEGRGWRAELTGPWPAYNFAHLDLSIGARA